MHVGLEGSGQGSEDPGETNFEGSGESCEDAGETNSP
jgi:hypothetical protein